MARKTILERVEALAVEVHGAAAAVSLDAEGGGWTARVWNRAGFQVEAAFSPRGARHGSGKAAALLQLRTVLEEKATSKDIAREIAKTCMGAVLLLASLHVAACGGVADEARDTDGCAVAVVSYDDAGSPDVSPSVDAAPARDAAPVVDAAPVDVCAQTNETQIQCYGTDTSKWKASKPIACRDSGSATSAMGCVVTPVHADWSGAPAAVWCCQ